MKIEVINFLSKPNIKITEFQRNQNSYFHFQALNTSEMVIGNGSGANIEEAQTKAVFEMIERSIFRKYNEDDISSSGWAAHVTLDRARENACFELFERDAALVTWLSAAAPLSDPNWETSLTCGIFLQPFLLATIKNTAVVMGAVVSWLGKRILVSACCKDIPSCLTKLKIDAERSVMIIENPTSIEVSPILKMHFAEFNKLNDDDIKWLFKNEKPSNFNTLEFEFTDYFVPLWNGSIAWVCRAAATNQELQKLFWGPANIKNINRKRLAKNMSRPFRINRMLHPII